MSANKFDEDFTAKKMVRFDSKFSNLVKFEQFITILFSFSIRSCDCTPNVHIYWILLLIATVSKFCRQKKSDKKNQILGENL